MTLGFCSGCAAPEPATYADCILRYVKDGQTQAATTAITEACRSKFTSQLKAEADSAASETGNPFDQFDDLIPKKQAQSKEDFIENGEGKKDKVAERPAQAK